MPPSVIRSLGATWPSRPSAELGIGIAPNAEAARPTPTDDRKNVRRDKRSDRLVFMPSTLSVAEIAEKTEQTAKKPPKRPYISAKWQPQVAGGLLAVSY